MSSISSGSALDVNALVSQLITAEAAPLVQRFKRIEDTAKAKISAFGTLSSAFAGLKSALDTLASSATFGGRSAVASDVDAFSATATSAAGLGSYNVEVESLASAHKLASAGLAKGVGLGAGQLTVTVDGKTFAVDIVAGKDTPEGIRDAINAAAASAGAKVNATIVEADDGQRLVLTATQAGTSSAIKVTNTSSPANATLNALVYDPGVLTSLTQQAAATNAKVYVDGVARSGNSNTITDFVPGLTLTLKKAAPGVIKTLTVSADNSAARTAVQGLVSAYNAAVTALGTATKYDAKTNTPSTLTGDSAARGAANQLRGALGAALSAINVGLPDRNLGLSTKLDGSLTLDSGKFDAALAAEPALVAKVLGGGDGLAGRLGAIITGLTGSNGTITNRTSELNGQLKSVATQRAAAERRLTAVEERYRQQFTALDVLLAQSQSTSNFLAQQLASLPTVSRR